MSRVSAPQLERMRGFQGGVNLDGDPLLLEANELSMGINVEIGPRGEIRRRKPIHRYDTNLSSNFFHRLIHWRSTGGNTYLIAVRSDGDMWRAIGINPAFVDTTESLFPDADSQTSWPVPYASAMGKLYISHRHTSGVPWSFDGTTWTPLAWTSLASPFELPKCHHLMWRFDHMFAANITGAPSQLRVSMPLEPTEWTEQPEIWEFDPQDGYEIRGLAQAGDDLLVFKEHSVHIFSGRVRADFAKYKLDSLRGTVSPRSIQQVRGLVIFFDRDTGIWAWDGSNFTLISEKINAWLLKYQDYALAYQAAAHVIDSRYLITIPFTGLEGSTIEELGIRTLVYSTLTGAWTMSTNAAFDYVRHGQFDFQASRIPGFGVAKMEASGDFYDFDAGGEYTSRVRTRWMQPGGPMSLSRLRRVEISAKTPEAVQTTNQYTEYDDVIPVHSDFRQVLNTDRPDAAASVMELAEWNEQRADVFMLEMVNSSATFWEISEIDALYSVNEDRRGVRRTAVF